MEFTSRSTTDLHYPSFEFIHSKIEEAINLDSLNSNLKSLVIIGEPLYAAPDVVRFKLLEDLWLVECSLHVSTNYNMSSRNLTLYNFYMEYMRNIVNLFSQ